MAQASIPVDIFNPGQVFACLGFLEAADVLLGDAEGGFDWSAGSDVRFHLRAGGAHNPVQGVLDFLAHAEVRACMPATSEQPTSTFGQSNEDDADGEENADASALPTESLPTFPRGQADPTALPVLLTRGTQRLTVSHWSDGSSRVDFKLYSGNRSAAQIADAMLRGTRGKPTKKNPDGEIKTRGLASLWNENQEALVNAPFDILTVMGGSFNFDARSAWNTLGAGFSPDKQKKAKRIAGLKSSPVVQILAPIGLEHARPIDFREREAVYGVWGLHLPPSLARPALAGAQLAIPSRLFRFTFEKAGKNRIVTHAEEESIP